LAKAINGHSTPKSAMAMAMATVAIPVAPTLVVLNKANGTEANQSVKLYSQA